MARVPDLKSSYPKLRSSSEHLLDLIQVVSGSILWLCLYTCFGLNVSFVYCFLNWFQFYLPLFQIMVMNM